MSSTSTSSCSEYADGLRYTNQVRRKITRTAIYSGIRNPLVYCARTSQPVHRNCRNFERKKKSPNFFLKAFKWYTEDRSPQQELSNEECGQNKDMTGFATWLDTKYYEFLNDSDDRQVRRLKLRQTSTIETEEAVPATRPCTNIKRISVSKTKRQKKRHSKAKGQERGDGRTSENRSVEYIMQPKELSRPPSQCYSDVCEASKASLASTPSNITKKISSEKQLDTASYTIYTSKHDISIKSTGASCKDAATAGLAKACQCGEEPRKTDIQTQCAASKPKEPELIPCPSTSSQKKPNLKHGRGAKKEEFACGLAEDDPCGHEEMDKSGQSSASESCSHCTIHKQNQTTSPIQVSSGKEKKKKKGKGKSSSKHSLKNQEKSCSKKDKLSSPIQIQLPDVCDCCNLRRQSSLKQQECKMNMNISDKQACSCRDVGSQMSAGDSATTSLRNQLQLTLESSTPDDSKYCKKCKKAIYNLDYQGSSNMSKIMQMDVISTTTLTSISQEPKPKTEGCLCGNEQQTKPPSANNFRCLKPQVPNPTCGCRCAKPKESKLPSGVCQCLKSSEPKLPTSDCHGTKTQPSGGCVCSKPLETKKTSIGCVCSKPLQPKQPSQGCVCSKPLEIKQPSGGCVCSKPPEQKKPSEGCVCSKPPELKPPSGGCVCSKPLDSKKLLGGCVCSKPPEPKLPSGGSHTSKLQEQKPSSGGCLCSKTHEPQLPAGDNNLLNIQLSKSPMNCFPDVKMQESNLPANGCQHCNTLTTQITLEPSCDVKNKDTQTTHGAAQTTDVPIALGGYTTECPLFMKIICADKLEKKEQ